MPIPVSLDSMEVASTEAILEVVPGPLTVAYDEDHKPSQDELALYQHVPDAIPWKIYVIGLVEMAERFSYFGTTVLFTNFIQQPLPPDSTTGAGGRNGQSGALGLGQRASTSISAFNVFWSYSTPLVGAVLSDLYWGRYKTIFRSIMITLIGQVLLVGSALPFLLSHYPSNPASLVLFITALFIIGSGSGGFKACISPLIAEQIPSKRLYVGEKNGRRVIVSGALALERLYMYLFLFINIGTLGGKSVMTYTEQYYGYYQAFTIPTIIIGLCPLVLLLGRRRYVWSQPSSSVLYDVYCLLSYGITNHGGVFSRKLYESLRKGSFWIKSKPSFVLSRSSTNVKPEWMVYTDEWVDEVRRAFKACAVFAYFPIYWLTYNQINNNLTSQAATMITNGIPNDLLSNIDPLTLIILIPVFDLLIFPYLRSSRFNITSVRRISMGFAFGCLAMVWAGAVQWRIYDTSPCGKMASTCTDHHNKRLLSSVNVMWQSGSYVLIAISEILAAIAGLEFAFRQAPSNMRSLVMSLFLLTNAAGSLLAQIFVSLSSDPYLVWNYWVAASLTGVAGAFFTLQFWNSDMDAENFHTPLDSRIHVDESCDLVTGSSSRDYQTF